MRKVLFIVLAIWFAMVVAFPALAHPPQAAPAPPAPAVRMIPQAPLRVQREVQVPVTITETVNVPTQVQRTVMKTVIVEEEVAQPPLMVQERVIQLPVAAVQMPVRAYFVADAAPATQAEYGPLGRLRRFSTTGDPRAIPRHTPGPILQAAPWNWGR